MKILNVQIQVADEVADDALIELGEWFQTSVPTEIQSDETLVHDVTFEIRKTQTFQSFDELVGLLQERHAEGRLKSLDSINFEMPDGEPVTSFILDEWEGITRVMISDKEKT